MSCMISRRNFMRCVGIGALAVASGSLLGGCTKFDREYGVDENVNWTDKNSNQFQMTLDSAELINPEDEKVKMYQLKTDKGQRYVFLHFVITNYTNSQVDLYEKRSGFFPFIKTEYTDDDIRKYFYEREKLGEEEVDNYSTWPNANQMADAPSVIWAYQNGNEMNRDSRLFGVICYNSSEGHPEKESTYAKIPEGISYIDCIGQIDDDFKILRLVYRMMDKEVNFVIQANQIGA